MALRPPPAVTPPSTGPRDRGLFGNAALARLHLITRTGPPPDVLYDVDRALAGGAPLVQLRVKGYTDRARWLLAREVSKRCHRAGARCIVNDRADVAAAVGADGVHLGDGDLPVAAARSLLGDRALVGATCRDPESARQAEAEGASYVGVGPVYPTTTKTGLPAPLGPAGVSQVARAVGVPVIAIGGVTASRVVALLDAGAHGVAVHGAVASAPDPRVAIEELAAAIRIWERSRR